MLKSEATRVAIASVFRGKMSIFPKESLLVVSSVRRQLCDLGHRHFPGNLTRRDVLAGNILKSEAQTLFIEELERTLVTPRRVSI